MRTKKWFSIVTVLGVLALVTMMLRVSAAPAAAGVSGVTFAPIPSTPGSTAAYTVSFTTGAAGALRAGADTITITFPAGTSVPTFISPANITVNGAALAQVPTCSQATRSVTMYTPVNPPVSSLVTVVIAPGAGLRNPPNSDNALVASFTGTVATSVEPIAVVSAPYSIKTVAAAANDVGITHKGKEYVVNPTLKANIPMVQVGDTLVIRSLTGGMQGGTDLNFGGNTYPGAAVGEFVPGAPLAAKIEGNPVTAAPAGVTVGVGAAGDPGRGKFSLAVVVPPLSGSSNWKKATFTGDDYLVEISDGTYTVQFSIWVVPKALVSPDYGKTGTTVTVTGAGFSGSRGIIIYCKDTSFASGGLPLHATGAATPNLVGATVVSDWAITTDSTGSFTGTFESLVSGTGQLYIAVGDRDGNWAFDAPMAKDETKLYFSTLATVSLSPTTGKPGDAVTLTGSDFRAGDTIKVWFGVDAADYSVSGDIASLGLLTPPAPTVDPGGEVKGVTITVPNNPPGTYVVKVRSSTAGAAYGSASFTVGGPATVTDALATITGRYSVVWGYDSKAQAWLKYDPTAPSYANTLSALKPGDSYWIVATERVTFFFGTKEVTLEKGGNLEIY